MTLLVLSGVGALVAILFWVGVHIWYNNFRLRQTARRVLKKVPRAPQPPDPMRTINRDGY